MTHSEHIDHNWLYSSATDNNSQQLRENTERK